MRRLRSRSKPDTMKPQLRKSASTLGHTIYFLLLVLLTGVFLWHMFGDNIVFRADGVVVQDHYKVEAPATLQVNAVYVEPGQVIEAGQPILRVDMTGSQMQMTHLAERIRTLEQDDWRTQQAAKEARRQMGEITQQLKSYEEMLNLKLKLAELGLSRTVEIEQTRIAIHELRKEQKRLTVRAEMQTDDGQTLRILRESFDALRRMIGDGIIRAPVAGRVGKVLVRPGAVATTGEEMMSVIHGNVYIVAYVDDDYLFSFTKGNVVTVRSEGRKRRGIVTEFLPFSESLPSEFHGTLKARRRSLLARIDVTDKRGLVKDQGVTITLAKQSLSNIALPIHWIAAYAKTGP
ncbi:MAG: HlyD family secretion protein [Hyphomicrobiaceae bacterium]